MWGMEYNPNLFSLYEESYSSVDASGDVKHNTKVLKQYGEFERKNVKTGAMDQQRGLSLFLVAAVLENKNKKLLKDAKWLDDVVKVICLLSPTLFLLFLRIFTDLFFCLCDQILSDITGNFDAKKACTEALKLHKKYLNKVSLNGAICICCFFH